MEVLPPCFCFNFMMDAPQELHPPQRLSLKWLPVWHLGLSLLLATALAVLVTMFWFPPPFHVLGGGMQLFWWMLGVDVVCGPLLTWILIRPGKTSRAITIDLILIAFLQWGALAYGVHTLALSRPLAIVFEVDRFRIISYSDVPEEELKAGSTPAWFTPWQLRAPQMQGLRGVRSLEEKMAGLESALQGVDAAQRPSRWQAYALSKPMVLARARPLEDLRRRYPTESGRIDEAVMVKSLQTRGLWLPVVGRRSAEWVALIDPDSATIVGYLPLDGFF